MKARSHSRVRVLAALSLLLAGALEAAATTPSGRWTGAITIPGVDLGVEIVLATSPDGEWTGSIDIPLQNARGLRLADIDIDGAAVRFRIDGVPGEPTFDGKLSEDGGKIDGLFRQAGQEMPFELHRPEPPPATLLESIDDGIDAALEQWRVPGAGVAVVRDGQVVLAKGYGLRDVEADLPATGRTLFAIGSATKAFTATVVAMLVDEGKLSWDEPVRTWLPDFALEDEVASLHATPRDLLSHRTGLPRHDLAWYGNARSREELFTALSHLAPTRGFRDRFQYQNLMFMTAGILAGRVTGSTWEDLVRDRIFEPLGMKRATLSIDALERDSDHAAGYGEEAASDPPTRKRLPYRRVEAVGPAGSINASAEEMARWLLFNLGGGEIEGNRLVAESALRELRTPQVVIPPEGIIGQLMIQPEMPVQTYGLGWFVTSYRGHELVHHGGNIDGFSAQVAFLPRDGAGVVVLTNKSSAFGALAVELGTIDRLLGLEPVDWNGRFATLEMAIKAQGEATRATKPERRPDAPPSHRFADYAGDYFDPGYGHLSVRLVDDALHVTFAGDDVALEPWHYDVFRTAGEEGQGTLLRFVTNNRGDVAELVAPLEPAAPEIHLRREPPAELRTRVWLERLAGDYSLAGAFCRVRLREDGVLTVTVAGQPTYVLEPYDGLTFDLQGLPGYSARFELDGERITGVAFVQPNGTFHALRVGAAER